MGADIGGRDEFVRHVTAEIQSLVDEITDLAADKGVDRVEADRLIAVHRERSGGCECTCRRSRPGYRRAAAAPVGAGAAAAPEYRKHDVRGDTPAGGCRNPGSTCYRAAPVASRCWEAESRTRDVDQRPGRPGAERSGRPQKVERLRPATGLDRGLNEVAEEFKQDPTM
jgi:hypothetical protein